jgi:hypothetical protein
MKAKGLLIAGLCISMLVCLGLALSNPTFSHYRTSLLTDLAEREISRQEEIEREAVEREAASIDHYFAAAHYEGSRLDVLSIQRRYPRLGAALADQLSAPGATLSERLMQVKQRALQRITVTRDTMLYSLLVDLSIHTTRTSYGLWSSFSTCHDNRLGTYLAIASQFFEKEPAACVSP